MIQDVNDKNDKEAVSRSQYLLDQSGRAEIEFSVNTRDCEGTEMGYHLLSVLASDFCSQKDFCKYFATEGSSALLLSTNRCPCLIILGILILYTKLNARLCFLQSMLASLISTGTPRLLMQRPAKKPFKFSQRGLEILKFHAFHFQIKSACHKISGE